MEKRADNNEKFKSKMNAWMMIQVIGQTSVNFLNIKKLGREMKEYIACLSQGEDLKEFAPYFIDACLTSKTYRTAVFGTMSMSDAGAAVRIAQDIDEVTRKIPEKFGLLEESAPVREALLEAFRAKIENADRILNEAGVI